MAYQPKSYRKFLAGSVTAALVASAVAPAASAAFTDTTSLDVEAQAAIAALAEAGVVKGFDADTFGPWENVKRGQVALMLSRVDALGLDATADTESAFTDVSGDVELVGAVEALVNAEIASGYGDTFKPYQEISRQHMAKLLVNAFGLELNEDAEVNVTDLDKATEEMRPYIQILASNGVTTVTEFEPTKSVSRYAFSLMLTRAMEAAGVVVGLPSVLEVTATDATTVEVSLEGTYTQEDVDALVASGQFNLTVVAGEEEHTVGKVTVKEAEEVTAAAETTTLVLSEISPELAEGVELSLAVNGNVVAGTEFEYVVVAPEVSGVSAINLKQLKVSFNTADLVEKDVETLSNYSLTDKDGKEIAISSVVLTGKEAIVTLTDSGKNQSTATLEVDGDLFGTDQTFDVEFFDITIPEVSGASVVGNDTIKVKFSEPLNVGALTASELNAAFDLDGGKYFVKSVTPLKTNTEFNVEFYTVLTEGEHTISVNNSFKDYAGYSVVAKDLKVNVVEDKEAPTVTKVVSASPTKVVLEFNEDIESIATSLEVTDFYHTNTSNAAYDVVIEGNTVTMKFADSYKLPAGTAYVYIKAETVKDLWDNKNVQQIRVPVEVTVDTVAPTVKEVKASAQDELTVVFSEELKEASAEKTANYTLLDKDGKELDIIDGLELTGTDTNEVVVSLSEELYGDYTLVVENVEDLAGNKAVKSTTKFNVKDKVAPLFTDFTATLYNNQASNATSGVETLIVNFGEAMSVDGANSVLDLSKYKYNSETLNKAKGVKITAINGNKSVRIDIDVEKSGLNLAVDAGTAKSLQIARVADAAGNVTADFSGNVAVEQSLTFGAKSVKATAQDKIVVTLEDKVSKFDKNDFVFSGLVDAAGNALNVSSAIVDDSGATTVVTFTLSGKLSTDAAGITLSTRTAADVQTANAFGSKLELSSVDVDDYIAPALAKQLNADNVSVDKVTAIGTDKVALTFTEDIEASTVSTVSFDVDGFNVTAVDVVDNVVTLTVAPKASQVLKAGVKVTQKAAIKDTDLNSVTEIATKVNFTAPAPDTTAPTAKAGTPSFTDTDTTDDVIAGTVNFAAASSETDIAKYVVVINDGTSDVVTEEVTASALANYNVTVSTTNLATGSTNLSIKVTAVDAAGNAGTAVTATVAEDASGI